MKFVLSTAAVLALLAPAAAFAQTAPAAPATPAATAPAAPAAKFNLDTPIETIVADPKAHAVLTADFGGMDVTTNPQYDNFKAMSLNQVAPYAPDKLTPDVLKKIATDLATVQ